jgi:outer membrane biosynthesis protein TonB
MSDDLLERMTKALRDEGGKDPSPERSSLVRARVLSQNKRRAQLRPQGMWQWAAVVCLGFFVSTAMAHVIKVQLPRVIEAFRDEPPAPAPLPKAAKRPRPAQPVQPKAAVPEPAPAPSEPVQVAEPTAPSANAEPSVPPQQQPAPARKPRPAKTAPRPSPKKPAPAPAETALAAVLPEDEPPPTPSVPPPSAAPAKPQAAESAELALFRRAQSLHLAKDTKAIEAWDAYLRVAGTSPLAPEARYNRALGLVRANRFTEAKNALAPFAQGKYGKYRREEAQALMARLPQ